MSVMTAIDDAAMMLARTAAHGVQIRGDCGGGYMAWLTVTDIAACCAGIPEPHLSLLYAKYRGDQAAAVRSIGLITDMLIALPVAVPNAQLVALSIVTLHVSPGRCRTCRGTGEVRNRRGVIAQCHPCDGSGLKPVSISAQARACGISRDIYVRRVAATVDSVLSDLSAGEHSALLHVWRRARKMS